MDFGELDQNFGSEDRAREFLEKTLWPKGAVCPHCGSIGKAYRLTPKPGKGSHVRAGVWKCKSCRKQFSVKIGTIFERSHVPLQKWLIAIRLMDAGKEDLSASRLHRMLGITHKTAWSLIQRIRRSAAFGLAPGPEACQAPGTPDGGD